MAHIREMIIESKKTLEESGSYRSALRNMTVTFRPDEFPLMPPDNDGNWTPIINALGKQLDDQVDIALGLKTAKAPEPATAGEKPKEEPPNPEDKPDEKDFKIRDPEAPMTKPQRRKIEGEMFGFQKAKGILSTYLTDNKIDSIDDLTMGHADKVIKAILKAKGGNDQ